MKAYLLILVLIGISLFSKGAKSKLASPCSYYFVNTDEQIRFKNIKSEVSQFTPGKVSTYPIAVDHLKIGKPAGGGWEGDVFYGTIDGEEIVIKFYKKEGLQNYLGPDLKASDYDKKLKQGHFLLFTVHQMGLAPKPMGYLKETEMKTIADQLGLKTSEYYGAMAMERIRPKFVYKSKTSKKLANDPKLMSDISDALKKLNEAKIEINDLDFMIDESNNLKFIDLDLWNIHNKAGSWSNGVLENNQYDFNNEVYETEIFLKAFK